MEYRELVAALRSLLPAALRAGGLASFVVVRENDRFVVSHQMGAGVRIATTRTVLQALEAEGLIELTEGWRGGLSEAFTDESETAVTNFDGRITSSGIEALLRSLPADQSQPADWGRGTGGNIADVARALSEARGLALMLARYLRAHVEAGNSDKPDEDIAAVVILERIIIPVTEEMETAATGEDQAQSPSSKVQFLQQLALRLWDTRVIGLINVILNSAKAFGL